MDIKREIKRIAKKITSYINVNDTFYDDVYLNSLEGSGIIPNKKLDKETFRDLSESFFDTFEKEVKTRARAYMVRDININHKIVSPEMLIAVVTGTKNGRKMKCRVTFEKDKVYCDGWYPYDKQRDKRINTVADVALQSMIQQ